jgi:hypothetical protein
MSDVAWVVRKKINHEVSSECRSVVAIRERGGLEERLILINDLRLYDNKTLRKEAKVQSGNDTWYEYIFVTTKTT